MKISLGKVEAPVATVKKVLDIRTPGERISAILLKLRNVLPGRLAPELYTELCMQVFALKRAHRPKILFTQLARASGKPLEDVHVQFRIKGDQASDDFDVHLPKQGWLADYLEWTRYTESPSVFHFFVGATIIGSSLARRVFFDKGSYSVYPNLCVMLIAPTGRCRKTSAANLGISLLTQTGGRLLADKTTPEALVDSLKKSSTALIYAPELAVFLGKQKYNEGMIPLLTAMIDCPEKWTGTTIGRGDVVIAKPTISTLMCSTVDWLQTAIPSDAFGGGFMSRFLFVVQEDTPRFFPLPPQPSKELRTDLMKRLAAFRTLKAPVVLTPAGEDWYIKWCSDHHDAVRLGPSNGHFAGYNERKPDHVLRLALVLAVSEGREIVDGMIQMTPEDLERAVAILTWLEASLPSTFDRVAGSGVGEDQGRILRQLMQSCGCADKSALLRLNTTRMNTEQFRRAITTLIEANLLEFSKLDKKYYLTPEGWGL